MNLPEIHLTKDDFILEWFSGTGKGGQHRNKHQNCCRITHKETGLKAHGTDTRSRVQNQKIAFTRLASLILSHYAYEQEKNISGEVIRNYHGVRNEVKDKASGYTDTYANVVTKANLGDMIEERKKSGEIL